MMGWIFYNRKFANQTEERAEVTRLLGTVQQMKKVSSNWYVAVEGQGVVIKTKVSKGQWGYKIITEDMGPTDAQAPATLIKRLSPTENAFALAWRNRCLANAITPKLKVGDILRSPQPINWPDHGDNSRFRVVSTKPIVFLGLDIGVRVRLYRHQIKELIHVDAK